MLQSFADHLTHTDATHGDDESVAGESAPKESSTDAAAANIIGKFGVGFYSAFMVSDRVDVFSSVGDGVGHRWSSAGDGEYVVAPCEIGDGDDRALLLAARVSPTSKRAKTALRRSGRDDEYSAFVGSPSRSTANESTTSTPLWTKRASEVSDEDAVAFYRFVGALDTPAFRLHFSADAPLTIRALLFAPEENPEGARCRRSR